MSETLAGRAAADGPHSAHAQRARDRARDERTARALDDLAQTGSDLATLLHAVSKGAVLSLGPASGSLLTQHPFTTHEAHGPLAEVVSQLAEKVRR